MRPASLIRLLDSINNQINYPNEIIIVDGSTDNETKFQLSKKRYKNLKYIKVNEENRGLTLQRNFGLNQVSESSEIICFLDDDIVLQEEYFENLMATYQLKTDAIAVGGYIIGETVWTTSRKKVGYHEFEFDGYKRKLGQRNLLRKRLGLLSDKPPGFMPEFSHGLSTGFLPPSGKIYKVEFFMGGVSSYRKNLFQKISFSSYFEGYGLYEDMDFCLRASKIGKLYVNTAAKVLHYHEESGRPDYYKYGKMVIENGFYVWKIKYPKSNIKAQIKHFSIDVILMFIRFINGISGDEDGINDSLGRIKGLWNLVRNKKKRNVS